LRQRFLQILTLENCFQQQRHYRIEGGKLFIESAPAPSIVFPGKTDFRRIVWVREK
jgi:hypothetical protein